MAHGNVWLPLDRQKSAWLLKLYLYLPASSFAKGLQQVCKGTCNKPVLGVHSIFVMCAGSKVGQKNPLYLSVGLSLARVESRLYDSTVCAH